MLCLCHPERTKTVHIIRIDSRICIFIKKHFWGMQIFERFSIFLQPVRGSIKKPFRNAARDSQPIQKLAIFLIDFDNNLGQNLQLYSTALTEVQLSSSSDETFDYSLSRTSLRPHALNEYSYNCLHFSSQSSNSNAFFWLHSLQNGKNSTDWNRKKLNRINK